LFETFYTLKYEALIGFAEIFSLNVYNLLVRLDKSNIFLVGWLIVLFIIFPAKSLFFLFLSTKTL